MKQETIGRPRSMSLRIKKTIMDVRSDRVDDMHVFGSICHWLCDHSSDLNIYVDFHEMKYIKIEFHSEINNTELIKEKGFNNTLHENSATTTTTTSTDDVPPIDNNKQINSPACSLKTYEHIFLTSYINPSLECIALDLKVKRNGEVPLVRMEIEYDDEDVVKVDICCRKDGHYKACVLRVLYRKYPMCYPLFVCLMHWARSCGILRGGNGVVTEGAGLMKSCEFHAFIINILLKQGIAYLSAEDVDDLDSNVMIEEGSQSIVDHAVTMNVEDLGQALLIFFHRSVHQLTKDQMTAFATLCFRAYHHHLSVSNSFRGLLEQAVIDESKETSFIYRLQPATSEGLRGTTEFHCLRLASITKALVTMEYDGPVLVIKGKGSRNQIQSLKCEILKLLRFSKILGIGVVNMNHSAYLLEGCRYLYVEKADSMRSTLSLQPYLSDSFQIHHVRRERSVPVLRSEPKGLWKENFKIQFISKIFLQLESETDEAVDALRFSVHFGKYYKMGAQSYFKMATSHVSTNANDLERALNSCRRNRSDINRPEYSSNYLPSPSDVSTKSDNPSNENVCDYVDDDNLIANETETDILIDIDKLKEKDERKLKVKKEKQIISAGYYSRINSIPFSSHKVLDNQGIDKWLESMFLGKLGYSDKPIAIATGDQIKEEEEEKVEDSKSHRYHFDPGYTKDHIWKVEVLGSRSYIADIHLNEDLNITRVSERSLNWVQDMLTPEDDLYKTACPHGQAPVKRTEAGKIKLFSLLKGKHRVMVARQTNGDLQGGSPATDLSLEIDITPLIQYYKSDDNNMSQDKVEQWLQRALDHVLLVSDSIRGIK
eukprot:gene1365-2637_t